MSLSNTAVPKYYGEFRDKVIRGLIPVCENISMEMNRIDSFIEDPGIYYDDEAVEGWIRFCENELTLTDGSPVKLTDSFKLWGEQIFGWYYFVRRSTYVEDPSGFGGHDEIRVIKKRLIKRQYLIVGRGAAKTLYDTFIHAYFLIIDGTATDQITVAPTMEQAEEVLRPLRTAVSIARGPLFKFMTFGSVHNTSGSKSMKQKLASTKIGIQNFTTNSILHTKPLNIEHLQGYRTQYATLDEWLSCDISDDPIQAIEQGASKYEDYCIIATSSEGTIRNGIGDSMKMELSAILRGDYPNPFVSIFWYRLDDPKEVGMKQMWLKANPNLGKTVQYEAYELEVERMTNNPSLRNDTLAKRFGIPTEGYTYFFTYEETMPSRPRSFANMFCSLGVDLSRGDDFAAFTFLFPLPDGRFGVKTRSYITEKTFRGLMPAMRKKYQEFILEGTLKLLNGPFLDVPGELYDDLDNFIEENRYEVCCMGYDPYNATGFIDRWNIDHSSFGTVLVRQGAQTESVPLGELKHLAEERALLFDESIMSYTMGNSVIEVDTNGNMKLYKKRREAKIDNVSALMDAFVAYKLNTDAFA